MGGSIEKTLRIGGGGDYKLSISSDSFQKDGRKISVGDCALFKPPQDSPPFIAIITRLLPNKDDNNNLLLLVNWLYRPSELELSKNILPKTVPNEIFYSFHTDKIPASLLLHPCKVAFLPKSIELPSNISCYICRRVYDTVKKCLWWLTDQNFINERQEEVDKLLYKTRIEMRTTVQPSDGSSPKSINGPTNTPQLTPGSDKGKKRERGDKSSEPLKRRRAVKTDDSDSENSLKSEIAKITEMSLLVDFEGVEKLVNIMQMDKEENNMDLTSRSMLASVLAATEKFECLNKFIELKGLTVLDQWLQDIHKGKIGDNGSEKSVKDFLLVLLRALDKLPVTLHALQMCNIGKSVNIYLSKHKSLEIQRRAKSLVDTWKKRVDAEMKVLELKSGANKSSKKRDTPSKSSVTQLTKAALNKETVKSTCSSPRTVKSNVTESPPKVTVNGPPSDVMPSPKSSTGGSLSVIKGTRNQKSGSGSVPKEKAVDVPVIEGQCPGQSPAPGPGPGHGQGQRLIVKIQMKNRSPGQSTSNGSYEEPLIMNNRASSSSPSPSHELSDKNNDEQFERDLERDLLMKESNNNNNVITSDVKVDELSKAVSSSSGNESKEPGKVISVNNNCVSSSPIGDDLGTNEMSKADVAVEEGENDDMSDDKKDDVAVLEGDGKDTSLEMKDVDVMIKNETSDEGNDVKVSDANLVKVEDANNVVMEDQVCNNVKMEEEDIKPVVKADIPDSRMVFDLNEALVTEENMAPIIQPIYPIARRGPFNEQADLFRNTGVQNGWTGSATTNVFHRPEPRRVPLFDLNVLDENESNGGAGVFDLDLNRIDQPPPTCGARMDFDLNDGPSMDDNINNNTIFAEIPPPGQGNTYSSTVTIQPSILPDRNVGPAHSSLPVPIPFPLPFQYPMYPLPPATFSVGSTLSNGRFFTSSVPVVDTVSSFYPGPYMNMGTTILPEANNNRWGPPGFDLNSGPGAEGQGRNFDLTGGTLPHENQPPWQ